MGGDVNQGQPDETSPTQEWTQQMDDLEVQEKLAGTAYHDLQHALMGYEKQASRWGQENERETQKRCMDQSLDPGGDEWRP